MKPCYDITILSNMQKNMRHNFQTIILDHSFMHDKFDRQIIFKKNVNTILVKFAAHICNVNGHKLDINEVNLCSGVLDISPSDLTCPIYRVIRFTVPNLPCPPIYRVIRFTGVLTFNLNPDYIHCVSPIPHKRRWGVRDHNGHIFGIPYRGK